MDQDGDIDSDDRTVIGNALPDFFAGLTNRFTYGNFELSVFLFGQFGNQVFNYTRRQLENLYGTTNQAKSVINRWRSPEQPGNGEIPRATKLDPNENSRLYSDRWVEDGSFLRLRNISLSYNLSPQLLERIGVGKMKIYVTGNNLFTWTNYSGFDPEVSSNGQNAYFPGYDLGAYPQVRSIIGGLNITF
jgi:hypothetical protein